MEADPSPDSPEGEYLDVMATLIQAYEAKPFPIEAPDPMQAIKFRMEQAGLEPKDLGCGSMWRVIRGQGRRRTLQARTGIWTRWRSGSRGGTAVRLARGERSTV